MSDRFASSIQIGGTLCRTAYLHPDDPEDNTTVLEGLISALNDDGASDEYSGAVIQNRAFDTPEVQRQILNSYLDGDVLSFKHDQARNGEFESTELFCREHDIPFDRWSDTYVYQGENVYFRAGMKTPVVTFANSDRQEMVDGDTVREAMALLAAYINPSVPCPDDIRLTGAKAHKSLLLLHKLCPDLPESLPNFEITD